MEAPVGILPQKMGIQDLSARTLEKRGSIALPQESQRAEGSRGVRRRSEVSPRAGASPAQR